MVWIDFPAITLITVNVVQMVLILLFLFPIFDIVTTSKYIKQYEEEIKKYPNIINFIIAIYFLTIFKYGILGPAKTFNELNVHKQEESSREKLLQIIESNKAARNNILGSVSLFFLLIIWRLLEYVLFSAKLHEFSDLMSNYDLIDITFVEESESDIVKEKIIAVPLDDECDILWPSCIDLNKHEISRIKRFFKSTDSDTTDSQNQIKRNKKEKRRPQSINLSEATTSGAENQTQSPPTVDSSVSEQTITNLEKNIAKSNDNKQEDNI